MKLGRSPSRETHLVQRAARGEAFAFELLFDLHRPAVRQLAMRMLRNADDAHDAVQDTFLKAYRAIGEFDPERPLRPWLCRICANCCVDLMRQRRKVGESIEPHEHALPDLDACPHAQTEEAFQSAELAEAVARLPETYRRIIFMRHYRDMEVNEIADALRTPEGTVKSWLFRARARLKKDLQMAHG